MRTGKFVCRCMVRLLSKNLRLWICGAVFVWVFTIFILERYPPQKLVKTEEGVCLYNVSRVIKYIVIVSMDALFMAFALGSIMELLKLGSLFSESTLILFFNNLVFSLVIGIPILILDGLVRGQGVGNVLNLNVRFVLIFLMLSVTSAAFMGIVTYEKMHHYVLDKVTLWNQVYMSMSLNFFIMCGLSVAFMWYLEKNITVPIEALTEIAKRCIGSEEDLKEQCRELSRFHGEPGYLAAAFCKLMEDVEHYVAAVTAVTAEKERIRSELTVAARLQADMLPDSGLELTDRRDFLLSARMNPAKEVGGDFYDFFMLDEDRLALVMADVSGKGVPAALFMVVARTLLRSHIAKNESLAEAVTEVNDSLCANNKNGMFVTAWVGIITLSTGELRFVNAGHNAPLLKRGKKAYEYLMERSGLVLAGLEDMSYSQYKIVLHPGDGLFLYTDGVTEAHDAHKNLYGDARLRLKLNECPMETPNQMLETVWRDLLVFRGKAEQFDDITMLSFIYKGENRDKVKKTFPAEQGKMVEVGDFVEATLKDGKFPQELQGRILMAVDEIFTNICSYSGAVKVTVTCTATEEETEVCFMDDGTPYNPLERKDPDVRKSLMERQPGGLGIYLVKKQMDEVDYAYQDGKNCLVLRKKRQGG